MKVNPNQSPPEAMATMPNTANMAPLTVAPKGSFRRSQSVTFMMALMVA